MVLKKSDALALCCDGGVRLEKITSSEDDYSHLTGEDMDDKIRSLRGLGMGLEGISKRTKKSFVYVRRVCDKM